MYNYLVILQNNFITFFVIFFVIYYNLLYYNCLRFSFILVMKVYEELKEYFRSKGITQVEIAQRLNVSQPYVGNVLSGKSNLGRNSAKKWADEFGLNFAYLLTGQGTLTGDDPADIVDKVNEDITAGLAPDSVEYWKVKYEEATAEIQRLQGIIEGLRMAMSYNAPTQQKKADVV